MPKLLATIRSSATDFSTAAREYAVAMATALDADVGVDILVGQIHAIARGRVVQIMFARPAGALIAMNIVPGVLNIKSTTVREGFRNALIAALGCHGRVRAFSSVRELIYAAREPAPQRGGATPPPLASIKRG